MGRKDLALLFPIGGGLQISLCASQPSIWNIMNMPQAAWNPHQRVPFLKLCQHPQKYIYTEGTEKNKELQKSSVITPSQGGQTRAQSSLLGHIPSTHSVLSISLWIYCPWMDHMSFFKCSFPHWATSQSNGYHVFTIHHRNKLFDFTYPKRN